MISLFLAAFISMSCPETVVVNRTDVWTQDDTENLATTKNRCVVHFPDSPCLKRFEKRSELNYWAICGAGK